MNTFKSRKQHETGKRRGAATNFRDFERRKCSKLVIPDMQKLIGLTNSFKEKCESNPDKYTMWHLQLKLSKELVQIASGMLGFLDLCTDLEELAYDSKEEITPLIDALINECQDEILDAPSDEKWERDDARDAKTKKLLDETIERMKKVVEMVFKSKHSIKTEDRADIMHLCCGLFDAADDLVKSATGDCLELDSELEHLLEEAVSTCSDQTLDEYLDEDCENEEEEDDDEEGENEEEEDEDDE